MKIWSCIEIIKLYKKIFYEEQIQQQYGEQWISPFLTCQRHAPEYY